VPNGARRFKRVPDWRDWMQSVNFVQLNEREAKYFGRSLKALADFAAIDRRVESVIITRGAGGTTILFRDDTPELPAVNDYFVRLDIPPVSLGPVRDSTGCGDVFGAAFLSSYAWRRNPVLAAQFGNFAGAAKSLISGIDQLDILRSYIQQYPTSL
jgi:sugar/nucleoside kinase (ribokinase family)